MARTPGGNGECPATKFYLNHRQTLFIMAKSEPPEATDITIEISERFDTHERGLAPSRP